MPPKAKAIIVAGRRIEVSSYDRVSSLLLALLMTIGIAAVALVILWWGNRVFAPQKAVPAEFTEVSENGEGGGNGVAAGGSQLDTPSDEPFVGNDKETTDLQQDLTALGVAVASKAAELDDPELVAPKRQGSYGSGGGIYGGFGKGRGLGHGPGRPGWPRHWEVVFSKNTLDAYARELDFFGIELGVLLPGNKIVYAFHLAKRKPDTRIETDPAAHEQRFYLTWRNGEMQQADRELLTRAGVDVGDSIILKFLPHDTEGQLIIAERDYQGLTPKDIQKTRFGVQAQGGGFVFFVLEQFRKR